MIQKNKVWKEFFVILNIKRNSNTYNKKATKQQHRTEQNRTEQNRR